MIYVFMLIQKRIGFGQWVSLKRIILSLFNIDNEEVIKKNGIYGFFKWSR